MTYIFGVNIHKRTEKFAQATAQLPYSYPEIGATQSTNYPNGYTIDHNQIELGSNDKTFERAREALKSWLPQQATKIGVHPKSAKLKPDESFLLAIVELPFFVIAAPSRVVYLIDEEHRFGYAYGTLKGHPERGEVRFLVQREMHGQVVFQVDSFSKRSSRLVKLARPIARRIQIRATQIYLSSMREFVNTN